MALNPWDDTCRAQLGLERMLNMSRIAASAIGALALVLVGIPNGAAQQGDADRAVTRGEYKKVRVGMARDRVERIFGAGHGKCVHNVVISGVRYRMQQYRYDPGADTVDYVVQVKYSLKRGQATYRLSDKLTPGPVQDGNARRGGC